MSRANRISLGLAVPILMVLGYLDGVNLGYGAGATIGSVVGFPLSASLIAGIIFGWKRQWRSKIPAAMLVMACIMSFGQFYSAADDPREQLAERVDATTESVRLGNTLAQNDRISGSNGRAADFVLKDGSKYVSSEHRTLDSRFRIASLYEADSPSFMVIYTRADGRPFSRDDISTLLRNENGTWQQTDSLTWWDESKKHPNGMPYRLAQCSTDRNTCTFSYPDRAGRFMSRSPELDRTVAH